MSNFYSYIEAFKKNPTSSLAYAFTAILAISIQIQISLFQNQTYLGLRINVTDILIPFIGIFIIISLITKTSLWPQWTIKRIYIWLTALTIIFIFALFNGYTAIGEWSKWALINKMAGWFVLMSYFLLGGWLVTNFQSKSVALFTKIFIFFFLGTLILSTLEMFVRSLGFNMEFLTDQYMSGFMGNRNAYGLLIVIGLSLIISKLFYANAKVHIYIQALGWSFLPIAMYYSGSRALWLATCAIVICMFVMNFKKTLLHVLPFLLIGTLICFYGLFKLESTAGKYIGEKRMAVISEALNSNIDDLANPDRTSQLKGDFVRFRVFKDAMNMWKKAPIQGGGLGAFIHSQYKKYGGDGKEIVEIIDSTPLWLLTETGLIGLTAFLSFYSLMIYKLILISKGNQNHEHTKIATAVVLSLIGFGVMSLFHELLYTRQIWLILGMALALPINFKTAQKRSIH